MEGKKDGWRERGACLSIMQVVHNICILFVVLHLFQSTTSCNNSSTILDAKGGCREDALQMIRTGEDGVASRATNFVRNVDSQQIEVVKLKKY